MTAPGSRSIRSFYEFWIESGSGPLIKGAVGPEREAVPARSSGVLVGDQRDSQRNGVISGMNHLMANRIVLPGYGFLRGYKATRLFKNVQQLFPDGKLEQMRRYGVEVGMTARHIDEGLRLISSIILHTGRDLDQLTAEDIFYLRARARRENGEAYVGTHSAWDLLRGAGVIHSKDTLKDALRHGQRPTTELVDSYNIQSTQIRNVLVRYLEERRPGVDYGTFRGLYANWLASSGPTSKPTTPASTPCGFPTTSSTAGSSGW
ncbi:hypothetical protein [Streptomyces sp. TRM68367]|uniref:hypothetical protein n=1 Tax=Streptomyces sp. TRM68367 TaxID=2758415 RepID=UPI001CA88897|nr:hypothetical protein [Streptomyces sp. TRM68367]